MKKKRYIGIKRLKEKSDNATRRDKSKDKKGLKRYGDSVDRYKQNKTFQNYEKKKFYQQVGG